MKTHLQAQATDPLLAFDGTHDTVVDFLRRRVPMVMAINTVIALLIALVLRSWDEVIPNLVISYCIGLCILALVAAVRCTVMQRFRGSLPMRFAIYVALIVAGAIGGELLSKLFLPRQSPTYMMHEGYIWLVAVVFSLVAASIALFINFSWVRLAQSKRDVERAERAAIEAQLRALQAQIEPHFLFNTLANLDALIATDAGMARCLLGNLIRYLRAALTHARSETATLHTEVELLKAYLAIMGLRLPNPRRCCCSRWWKTPSRMVSSPRATAAPSASACAARATSSWCRSMTPASASATRIPRAPVPAFKTSVPGCSRCLAAQRAWFWSRAHRAARTRPSKCRSICCPDRLHEHAV